MDYGGFPRQTSFAQTRLFEPRLAGRKSRHYMQKALQLVGRRPFRLWKRRGRDSNGRLQPVLNGVLNIFKTVVSPQKSNTGGGSIPPASTGKGEPLAGFAFFFASVETSRRSNVPQ